MSKKTTLILIMMSFALSVLALINTWQGDVSHAWSTPTNWALNHVPTTSEGVYIPDVGDYPYISATGGYTAYCNSISIASGATLRIADGTLNVTNDMTIYGQIWMSYADAVINVDNDIIWYSGSTELISYGIIQVAGDWTFEDGCNVTIEPDNTVVFDGSSNQFLYVYDSNSYFGNMTVDQTGTSALWLQNASTYDIHVDGDLTIANNSLLQVQSNTLTVDGTLDIENGSKMYLEHAGGELINNSALSLNGEMDIDGGDVLIHGEFDLASAGILIIDGGSFIYDVGNGENLIRGTLNISDGLYSANEEIVIYPSANTNVTGGLIRTNSIKAEYSGTFLPTAGTVEIRNDNGPWGSITCSNGNYFRNLSINLTSGGGVNLYSDITVQNDLEITAGPLFFESYEVTVCNNVEIYGGLHMDNSSDILNVGNDIIWYSGSYDYILTHGNINVSGDWYFNDGTDVQLGTGNTVNFIGSGNSTILCDDSDAEFGNLVIDQSMGGTATYIHSSSTDAMHVAGDMTVNSGNTFHVWHQDLIVDGTLDIQNTALMDLITGTLTNNSDFTLNGELVVGSGDALIHGAFDLETTGELTIDGGSFVYDESTGTNDIYGTLNISDGLYSADEPIYLYSGATTNITGGTLRTKGLRAEYSGTFQPTGGTVEIQTTNGGHGTVLCSNSNYLNILKVNPILFNEMGGAVLHSDLSIQNDLVITTGTLNISGYEVLVNNSVEIYGGLRMVDSSDILIVGNDITFYSGSMVGINDNISEGTINISGDWTFDNGTDAQLETGNTVTVVGSDNSYIYCDDDDACFGNLTIDKDSSADMVEVNSNNIIRTANDLNVTEGMLKIYDQSTLEIGNEFNIYSSFYTQGTSSNDAVISKYGTGFFDLNVETGGMIGGSYTTFENIGSAGVNIKTGAFLDALYSLNNCTFQNGETGGSLLTIDNSQTVSIDGAEFYAGSRDAIFNVTKTVDAGEITFTNSSGLFDGPDYEDDIHDRIHWSDFSAPTITTTAITDIEQTTATGGGNVTADGGSTVTARGVCWSISSDPTIADDHTTNGSGTGTFVSSLTGLDPDTHYYVRAYATNALGTSYGTEQEFDTLTGAPPDPPANLTIEIVGNDVVLTWDEVSGCTYTVYSDSDPEGSFMNVKQTGITATNWSETVSDSKLFYRVTAAN